MENPKSADPLRAAIYCRISSDREGRETGVDRQEADCRALVERLGYELVEVFVENDTGASTRSKKHRPLYAEMIDGARTGQWDVIVAYSSSRLTRRPLEGEALIALYERFGTQFVYVVSSRFDLGTADGRMSARIAASIDTGEAERTAERVTSYKAQAAAKGLYRGGPRPYGFDKDGLTVREDEAAVIREATRAVIAGRTLAAIARELNEAGRQAVREKPVKGPDGVTVKGKSKTVVVPWTYNGLRDSLLRPRNAGLVAHGLPGRSHHRQLQDRRKLEIIGKAKWPAIVTEDEWRALVALLTDPSRRTTQSSDPRWLGSGIYRCGVCGAVLRAAPHGGTAQRPYQRKYLYRCSENAHLTISTGDTDDYVRGVVAELVRDPRVAAAMNPGDASMADRERRGVLSMRLANFDADYSEGRIPAALWQKSTERVNEEMAEVDSRLANAMRRSSSASVMNSNDPGAAFLAAPIDIQRAVLSSVLRVEIITAKEAGIRIGGVWSSERVKITPVA